MRVVLDVETNFTKTEHGTDPSPYNHNNKLVTFGYHIIETNERGYIFLNHTKRIDPNAADLIQAVLDKATLVIGHNLKFDMSWLYECGYKYDGRMYDTMIFEYVACKGRKVPLSLSECAIRNNLTLKLDIFKQRMAEGLNTDEMDPDELEEYGLGDIQTTLELFLLQRQRYVDEADIRTMWPAMNMSMDTLRTLIDIERAGIAIDTVALDDVEQHYRARKAELETLLKTMVRDKMGDTPFNLSSGDDMSAIIYSIRIKDKEKWKEEMNIGKEDRGSVKKQKYLRRKTPAELSKLIRQCFVPVYRTDMHVCPVCNGTGRQYKLTKKGVPYAKQPKCLTCEGNGVIYKSNGKRGGFGVSPISWEYASASGFSTDKTTVVDLLEQDRLTDDAKVFLQYHIELSAIDAYLSHFVEGIRKSIRSDGLCHPNFNQCVTATGRLSSSGPNWQNQPRGNTFPIRKTIVSRWAEGCIVEADFAALEYRTAVALADCPAGKRSLALGQDRHQITAEIVFNIRKEGMDPAQWKEYRQNAKSRSFRPLYGGTSGTEREMEYNKAFFVEHTGIAAWHDALCNDAIMKGQIKVPSGRIFAFPGTVRKSNGGVTNKPQIVNYPVQSFASADICWSVVYRLWQLFKEHKVKSKLILQVHDSITADVHPDEFDLVVALFRQAFDECHKLLYERFKYTTEVDFTYEISVGKNLMDKKEIA